MKNVAIKRLITKESSYPEMDVLFRAKTNSGRWAQGFYYKDPESDVRNSYIIVRDFEFKEVKGFTLCEYTRLCDKRFKKIFTHDIVTNVITNDTGEVLLSNGSFVIKYVKGYTVHLKHEDTFSIEVVSNSIDKPNYLKDLIKTIAEEEK